MSSWSNTATMRRLLIVLFVFGLFATGWSQLQVRTPSADIRDAVYLLRMERAQNRHSVCVLLKGDGQYHLERHTLHKVRVFEGRLEDDDFRSVVQLLSGERLFHLEQKQIPDLMLKADSDPVVVEIHRGGYWQQLLFPDSASRDPFRDELNPLLKWFDAANKRKMRELSEESGRNNCLPPAKSEFAQRKPAQPEQPADLATPSAEVPTTTPAAYTLQMFDQRMVKFRVEVACLLISKSGAYHFVKQSKGYSGDVNTAALDGMLAPPDLAALHALLAAPDLANQREHEPEKDEFIFTENSYVTRLSIPRGETVQKITAWKSYRLVHNMLTQASEEHGGAMLAPLRDWLKINIDERKAIAIRAPANPRCSPDD